MDRKISLRGGSFSVSVSFGKSSANATASAGNNVPDPATAPDRARSESSGGETASSSSSSSSSAFETRLGEISGGIEGFMKALSNSRHDCQIPPDVPEWFDHLVALVDGEASQRHDARRWSSRDSSNYSFLDAVQKLSRVAAALTGFPSESKYSAPLSSSTAVLQRAMAVLEEDLRCLLEDEDSPGGAAAKPRKQSSFCGLTQDQTEKCASPEPPKGEEEEFATYAPEVTARLRTTAATMMSAGYATECCQVYSVARRKAIEEGLRRVGMEKLSMDEVQRLPWESLEGEISTWTKACKRCVAVYFPGEKRLCDSVFSDNAAAAGNTNILGSLVRAVVIQLNDFAEAVAMTRRSTEKLFKFLDMYEALRDLTPALDDLFPGDADHPLKSETASARRRLGQAAVGSFSDLENSIKADAAKVPVPGGAVHPLTRYVMNYLKYAAGEYKDTMEQVYREHKRGDPPEPDADRRQRDPPSSPPSSSSPFVAQLNEVMDLLDGNLDAKSKLYKDPSLRSIFLMNNKRYIMQKIKGSAEIHALLGDTRKRAAELRLFHKNYTRETWSKVLACLKDEGLVQGKGSVNKTVLKERFKSFNAMFEEIHKTQTTWVVSDEQLQSELRVSITAVVVPAYRSFLGRYRQHLDSGRNAEKYIKFGPEELESSIEDLFDGTPASMVRRRS